MKKTDTFAARLLLARERAGLSIADLARATALPRQTISKLERGERQPSLQTARILAVSLGCSLDWLAGLVE